MWYRTYRKCLGWARYGATLLLLLIGCAGSGPRAPIATLCPGCTPEAGAIATPLPRAEPGPAEVGP